MKNIFSDFLRSMGPDGEPSGDALNEVWTELRQLLHRQIRQRSLGEASPRSLGVEGYATWTEPGVAAPGGPLRIRDALDELTTDCYVELFVRGLPALRRYLLQGPVEPFVQRSIRNFLTDRQRRSDPLGFRLFQHLVAALRPAVMSGRLHILAGESRVDNSTVLGFTAESAEKPVPASALEPKVRRFNDEMLLDWFSAQGTEMTVFRQKLTAFCLGLEDQGIAVLRFQDLLKVVKRDVRVRHAFFWAGRETREGEELACAVMSTERLEKERFAELSSSVEGKLRRLDVQRRTLENLLKLWRFLIRFALAAVDDKAARDSDRDLEAAVSADHLPSNRELARLLGIRHDRIPKLLDLIRTAVEYCQLTSQQQLLVQTAPVSHHGQLLVLETAGSYQERPQARQTGLRQERPRARKPGPRQERPQVRQAGPRQERPQVRQTGPRQEKSWKTVESQNEIHLSDKLWYLSLAEHSISEIQVGKTLNLTLQLTRNKQLNSQPFRIPTSALELTAYAEAPGFALDGEHVRTLPVVNRLPLDRHFSFNLTALASGEQRVRVTIYPGRGIAEYRPGEWNIYLDVLPKVGRNNIGDPAKYCTIPDPQPQVTIYVEREEISSHQQVRLYISCPALNLNRERMEAPIPLTDQDLVGLSRASIRAATGSGNMSRGTLQSLRAFGGELFNKLMPAGHRLRNIYKKILRLATASNTPWSWLVVSDERVVLPWELICPCGHRKNADESWDEEFLASKFIVSHWVGRQGIALSAKAPLNWLALNYNHQHPHDLPLWQDALRDQALEALIEPYSCYHGLHLLCRSQRFKSRRTSDEAEDNAGSGTSPKEIKTFLHSRCLDVFLRRPIVAMSLLRTQTCDSNKEDLTDRHMYLESDWIFPFIRAGASALVGPRWPVSAESDQRFYRNFYRTVNAGKSLGWSVWNSREELRRTFPRSSDWLAYTYFGHPECEPYRVRESEGFALFEILDHPDDVPLRAGKAYRFRASLRSEAPVWCNGRLRAQKRLLAEECVSVIIMPLSTAKPETYPLRSLTPDGDYYTIISLVMPNTEAVLPVLIKFQKDGTELQTLIMNLSVIK